MVHEIMAIDQDTVEVYRWLATANTDNYTRATDTSRISLMALFPGSEPTHTLLNAIPNSLQLTQLHYAHQLPSTNPVPNSTPDQS